MDGWTLKIAVIYESRIQFSIALAFPSHYRYHPRDLSLLEEIVVTDCFYVAIALAWKDVCLKKDT